MPFYIIAFFHDRETMRPGSHLEEVSAMRAKRRLSQKWQRFEEGVIPAWIADMDFDIAEPIQQALREAVDRSDLGYPLSVASLGLADLVCARMAGRYGWRVSPAQIELLNDVVQGVSIAVSQLSNPGDGVVVLSPSYPPLLKCVTELGRRLLEAPMREGDYGYEIDFEWLNRNANAGVGMLLLCNPHNPTGRVFTRGELEALGEFALKRDMVIVSDEVHQDLMFCGHRHIPIASLSDELHRRTVTFTSAAKAFNLNGIGCAVALFGSMVLQQRFNAFPVSLRGHPGCLSLVALKSAWDEPGSQQWLDQTLVDLERSRNEVFDFFSRRVKCIRLKRPEATYLAWCDCNALNLSPSPFAFFLERAQVAFSCGSYFGAAGHGFIRVNYATTMPILEELLRRVEFSLSVPPCDLPL